MSAVARLETDSGAENMSPPRAIPEPPAPLHDATKLSVPVLIVVSLVMTVLSGSAAYYATTWGLRSDIRSVGERQEQIGADFKAVKEDIREIRAQLPNKEALQERLRGMEKDIQRLESGLEVASPFYSG